MGSSCSSPSTLDYSILTTLVSKCSPCACTGSPGALAQNIPCLGSVPALTESLFWASSNFHGFCMSLSVPFSSRAVSGGHWTCSEVYLFWLISQENGLRGGSSACQSHMKNKRELGVGPALLPVISPFFPTMLRWGPNECFSPQPFPVRERHCVKGPCHSLLDLASKLTIWIGAGLCLAAVSPQVCVLWSSVLVPEDQRV